MSYAIQTTIFGIPITSKLEKKAKELNLNLADLGFEILYTGGDELAGYLGKVAFETDECQEPVNLDTLLTATIGGLHMKEDDVLEVTQATLELPPEIRAACEKTGYWLIWSRS